MTGQALLWVVAVPVGIWAACLVVLPVLFRRMLLVRRNPTVVAFDPDVTSVPAEVREYFDRLRPPLAEAGFRVANHLALPNVARDNSQIVLLMTHAESGTQALAWVTVGTIGGKLTVTDANTEFVTGFADGAHHTLRGKFAVPLPRIPGKTVLRVDDIDAPVALWRVHRRAAEAWWPRSVPRLPDDVDRPEYVRRELVRAWEELREAGWAEADEATDEFRLTWTGACLTAWQILWPVSAIRRAARRRRNGRLFAEWGLADLA